MVIDYIPKGVCSRAFHIEVDNDSIQTIEVMGGCDGNLKGISSLLRGMKVEEAIACLEGIHCGSKQTSCPDQIAQALKQSRQEV